MGKNIVIAASRTVPVHIALGYVAHELAALPPGSSVFLRKPTKRPASRFEMGVAVMATKLDLLVRWWEPGPGGRQATFLRDVSMVSAADEVLAYFTEAEVMTGGTGHVIDKALDQAKTCRAYSIVGGELRWVGGQETEDQA